jgi:serine/threonine protein kinase
MSQTPVSIAPKINNRTPSVPTVLQVAPCRLQSVEVRPQVTLTFGSQIGDYRIIKLLGAGGMGAVYWARDLNLDRNVAIKVLLPEYSSNREAQERFTREAKAAAGISHDNVLSVYQVGMHQGLHFLVMPLLRGYSLEKYLSKKGTPSIRQTIRMIREVLLGLAAAHARGVIHRDIKPGNIWLEAPSGRVKILDFGIAKPTQTGDSLTKSGVLLGTPAYMSPEQARGLPVDQRSDLFSVGVLLYRLLTGAAPFAKSSVMETLTALASEAPRPPRDYNPHITNSLQTLLLRLLAKQPEHRFRNCQELLEELRTVDREYSELARSGDRNEKLTITGQLPLHGYAEAPGFNIVDDGVAAESESGVPTVKSRKTTTRRPRRRKSNSVQKLTILLLAVSLAIAIIAGGVGWLIVFQGNSKPTPSVPVMATPQPKIELGSDRFTIPELPIANSP